jgi:hypothetical protein
VAAAVTFAVFSSYYVAAMTAALVACECLIVWRTRGRPVMLRLAAASAPAFVLLALFSIPYLDGPTFRPDVDSFDGSVIAARAFWSRLLDPGSVDPGLGWGLVVLAAGGFLLPLAQRRRPGVRWWRWLALTVVGASLAAPFVVTIGSIDLPMPSALLSGSRLRAQTRWILLAHLGLVGFAAECTAAAFGRLTGRGGMLPLRVVLSGALLAAVWVPRARHLVDQPPTPLPVGAAVPGVYRWLARNASGPLFEPPGPSAANWLPQADAMVLSIQHWLPLLNGHTGFPPWQYQAVLPEMRRLPDREALQTLVDLTGLRWVLVRPERVPPGYFAAWEAFDRTDDAVARVPHGGPELLLHVRLAPRHAWAAALARGRALPGETALGTPLAPLDEARVRGRVIAGLAPRLAAGTTRASVVIAVANAGAETWPALVAPRAADPGVVRLAVRWRGEGGEIVDESFHSIPRDVIPGGTVRFRTEFRVPSQPGTYDLEVGVTQRAGAAMRGVVPAHASVVVDRAT